MPGGRKGFYEELRIKKYLSELTPKMFEYVLEVMNGEDKQAKERMIERILPKIIDKGMPTQLTGEDGGAIIIQVAQEILQKHELTPNTIGGSEG
jgi:hypothetical protein